MSGHRSDAEVIADALHRHGVLTGTNPDGVNDDAHKLACLADDLAGALADRDRELAQARQALALTPWAGLSPLLPRAADRLAAECERAIRDGRLDARSPIADATLDYRDMRAEPPTA